jgi:hypothetical protein
MLPPGQRRAVLSDSNLYWLILTVVAMAELAPLALIQYLPLVDLPNHEAGVYVLAHYASDPSMRKYFIVDWRPIPDMGFELFSVPLVRLGISPILVARAFLGVAIAVYVAAGHLLAKAALGRRSLRGLLLPLMFYNSTLAFGFVDFTFGLSLSLFTFALWFRWRAALTPLRTTALTVLASAAMIAHLSAYGFLLIAVLVTLLADRVGHTRRPSQSVQSTVMLAPPLVILGVASLGQRAAGAVSWDSPVDKAKALIGLFLSYNYTWDVLTLGGIAVIFFVAVARSVRVNVNYHFAAIAVAFVLLFVVLPYTAFTASDVDVRALPPAVVMAVCAVQFRIGRRLAVALTAATVAVGLARVGLIADEWLHLSRSISREVQRLNTALPRNATVYAIFPEGASWVGKRERPYRHIVSYATLDRNAHVSTTFAARFQQPLVSRIDERAAARAVPPYTLNYSTLRRYAYVWTYKPSIVLRRQLVGRCTAIYGRDGFFLCRVVRRKRRL